MGRGLARAKGMAQLPPPPGALPTPPPPPTPNPPPPSPITAAGCMCVCVCRRCRRSGQPPCVNTKRASNHRARSGRACSSTSLRVPGTYLTPPVLSPTDAGGRPVKPVVTAGLTNKGRGCGGGGGKAGGTARRWRKTEQAPRCKGRRPPAQQEGAWRLDVRTWAGGWVTSRGGQGGTTRGWSKQPSASARAASTPMVGRWATDDGSIYCRRRTRGKTDRTCGQKINNGVARVQIPRGIADLPAELLGRARRQRSVNRVSYRGRIARHASTLHDARTLKIKPIADIIRPCRCHSTDRVLPIMTLSLHRLHPRETHSGRTLADYWMLRHMRKLYDSRHACSGHNSFMDGKFPVRL